MTNAFEAYLRRTNVSSANGATVLTTNGYSFDLAGRLSTACDGTFVAAYSYLANSPLVSQIEFKSNTTVRLTTTKTFDNLNRLTSIASVGTGSTPSVTSYAYSYICTALCTLFIGCAPDGTREGSTTSAPLVSQADRLYKAYLTNDAAGAKRSMEEAVHLLSASADTGYAKGNLWLAYARLFCIESGYGEPKVASLYFEKARYWYLINLEEVVKVNTSNVVEKLGSFTRNKCFEDVLEFDKAFTHGKGARYFVGPVELYTPINARGVPSK